MKHIFTRRRHFIIMGQANSRITELLSTANSLLSAGDLETCKMILDNVEHYKPVDLLWHLTYAKYLIATGEPIEAVIDYVSDKYYEGDLYDDYNGYYSLLLELYAMMNGTISYNSLMYRYCKNKAYHSISQEDELNYISERINILRTICNRLSLSEYKDASQVNEGIAAALAVGDIFLAYLIHHCNTESTFPSEYVSEVNLTTVMKLIKSGIFVNIIDSSVIENDYTDLIAPIFHFLEIKYNLIKITSLDELSSVYKKLSSDTDKLSLVLSRGTISDELCLDSALQKHSERLTPCTYDYMEDKICACRVGGYLDYIASLVDEDYHDILLRKPEFEYSIVIPVRNNAETLRHTLKSCLLCDYSSYEILVSDNSDSGNDSIRGLCCELNNSKIRYIHTPVSLPLQRSFEYAVLHSKGKFIIPLGADDGILPWIFEVLDKARSKYENADFFKWRYAGYQWPGSHAHGQYTNMLTYPFTHKENMDLSIHIINSYETLSSVANDVKLMYSIPTFYIHSGFNFSYLARLLENTGRLWGGINQDITTGVLNLCLNKEYYEIEETLSIVGMSNRSIGSQNLSINRKNNKILDNNQMCGISVPGYIERLIPNIGGETIYYYIAILYAIERGVLDEDFLKKINSFEVFDSIISQLTINDYNYGQKLRHLACGAEKLDSKISEYIISRYIMIGKKAFDNDTTYDALAFEEQINTDGSFMIDATKHGITNVYDAVNYIISQQKL